MYERYYDKTKYYGVSIKSHPVISFEKVQITKSASGHVYMIKTGDIWCVRNFYHLL